MRNEKFKTAIKIILPVIFAFYFCSISFFTHNHTIDGTVISHSHPYKKDKQGSPAHQHTTTQIHLINILSSFFVTGSIIVSFVFGLQYFKKHIYPVKNYTYVPDDYRKGLSRLRPPPSFTV